MKLMRPWFGTKDPQPDVCEGGTWIISLRRKPRKENESMEERLTVNRFPNCI